MRKITLLILTVIININVYSQDNLLEIENESISLDEFNNIFNKNNDNQVIDKKYLDEYIELFINFKLKVREAKELGYDTLSTFVDELEGYRKQLAKPYLRDDQFNEEMFDEALERVQYDLNASHILININDENNDIALSRINNIRREIINNNISFEEAAVKYSDDKSAIENKGNLGYFTAFMMVYVFESAAYSTKVGSISQAVKTQYGYHLIKINDKRKAVGQRKVAHIMFKTGKSASKKKIDESNKKIFETYNLLKNGDPFAEVAERFSEDRSTAVKGGMLPMFGVGKMVPVFENIAFGLKNIGDFSEPFETDFGWHIVMLIEDYPVELNDDLYLKVKTGIEKDSRSKLSSEFMSKKLKELYTIKVFKQNFNSLRKLAVKDVSKSSWDGKNAINLKNPLFKIEGMTFNQDLFTEYILKNQKNNNDFDMLYLDFRDICLFKYEETQLENKYPEFKILLNEYREGILLFDLTNKNVWKKAVDDSLGLSKYFANNLNKYNWDKRVDASIYKCINLATAKKVKSLLYKLNRGNINNSEILDIINKESQLNLQIISNKFVKDDNDYIDSIDWKTGISKDIKDDDGSIVIVNITDVLEAGSMTLNEVKGKVISDYQKYLDNNWISYLRSKYKYSINKELLYTLIK
jgi:peptidyl-prolyl cis-trans isomerase SurA|tara:strand:+ start:1465 stop:3384 length:1920 start_codon:yes stop_codon:yes gene_type:complete